MKYIYRYALTVAAALTISGCSTSADSSLTAAALHDAPTRNAEMEAFLPAHNAVRIQHRLPQLAWSPRLAGYAQQWASHLQRTNNCNMKHRPRNGRFAQQYGENLFWVGPIRWSDGRIARATYTPEMITYAWADERRDYRYRSNSCKSGKICGHYTQIVWRDTQQLGCAKAICRDQSQLWVCNYNPPGNYRGKKPY